MLDFRLWIVDCLFRTGAGVMAALLVLPLCLCLSCHALYAQTFSEASHLLEPRHTGGKGKSAADINNDGRPDILRARRLYVSTGEAGFVDVFPQSGLTEPLNLLGASFGDFNNDGWLDIFYEDFMGNSMLFLNNRDTTFTLADDIGLAVHEKAQAAAWADFNRDGTLDLFVVNDDGRNQLFKNQNHQRYTGPAPRYAGR